jgi:uncharacterized Fe-S cluster-containing radical SAM superfamily protein
MSKRAERRHHRRRMQAKARRYYRFNNSWNHDPRSKEWEDAAATRADHIANCSCAMCGNPRKWLKEKTRQEYESEKDFREQLRDNRK